MIGSGGVGMRGVSISGGPLFDDKALLAHQVFWQFFVVFEHPAEPHSKKDHVTTKDDRYLCKD